MIGTQAPAGHAVRTDVPTFQPPAIAKAAIRDFVPQELLARLTDGSEQGAPEVGQMAMWTSETRNDVSGTSTVTASDQQANADGLQCIQVTDVVIVNGEEARADKRMCRRPPAARYTIAA